MNAGFLGIGHMGLPMARNLLRAGVALTVWSRSPENCAALADEGAHHADSVDALFAHCTVVFVMLLNEAAVDAVLGRGTPAFAARVAGRTVVQLGTTSPEFSASLAADLHAAGGSYVEAPVSGSRVPAEQGRLVGMVAGADADIERVLPLITPLCADVFRCGAVPGALRMKLAANHFLIGLVTVLAETVQAAQAAGVDLQTLREVLDAGPMASAVSRMKLAKLVAADFSTQAAIHDVATIAQLVVAQCRRAGAAAPLIRHSAALYERAAAGGHAREDMIAVIHAFAGGDSGIASHPTQDDV